MPHSTSSCYLLIIRGVHKPRGQMRVWGMTKNPQFLITAIYIGGTKLPKNLSTRFLLGNIKFRCRKYTSLENRWQRRRGSKNPKKLITFFMYYAMPSFILLSIVVPKCLNAIQRFPVRSNYWVGLLIIHHLSCLK